MVNKKKPGEKKDKGILLMLIPEKRKQLYDFAAKENRKITSIIEEALDNYFKNKLATFESGFGNFNDGFDLDKELNIDDGKRLW